MEDDAFSKIDFNKDTVSEPKLNKNNVFCNKKLEEEISNEVMKNKSTSKDFCIMEDISNIACTMSLT